MSKVKRAGRWLPILLVLAPSTALASGPVANSAFNLQGGAGAWQLEEGESLFRSDLRVYSFQELDDDSRGTGMDLRVGADFGITDRVQVGGTLPFRSSLDSRNNFYGRHARGDLRVLLNSDDTTVSSVALWGTVVESDSRRVNSGDSEFGVQYNWSRREGEGDLHFSIGTERLDYPEARNRYSSDSRFYIKGGLVERMSPENSLTLEFELGRTYSGDHRTLIFMPGMRWYQPASNLVWTGHVGLAPDAVPGRPSFSAQIGVTYLMGAMAQPDDRRVRRLEQIAEDHESRISGLEEWVESQPGAPQPDEPPDHVRIIIQDTMGDEARAEAWGRRFEEWGDYRLERVDYLEVDEEPSSSTIYYGPNTADAAVELGRRIPTGFQEVLRNEAITESGVIWLRMGRDMERYPESFDAL